jgi:ATP adenylyltransferase
VSFEQLWAGWRASYVGSVSEAHSRSGEVRGEATPVEQPGGSAVEPPPDDEAGAAHCVFCRIVAGGRVAAAGSADGQLSGDDEQLSADEDHFVLWRGERVIAMLNAYPYASGHLMVMPTRHVGELERLEPDESAELWSATQAGVRALKAAYAPDGLNLGLNLGRAAGAGIPAHLHVHVVPRWIGDTNFTTSVAALRVLPEAITESWSKLRRAWSA